ncbi:trehalase family glycosidase [Egicoccus sp. AB-alg2]|uniref:MGH1-like glycoside hydrolase domain-containing protein n=1 Tax=Egicoccus sp. AB-alg2 TaxID=3242693 RepID=UPI00359CDD67
MTMADVDLAAAARQVLDANWMGHATRPSPRLYPHQWSWDSAFMAMGQATHDPARAQQELRSLFAAQWSNGLVPHIVFSEGQGRYFPGPDFWQSPRCPYAPRRPLTSGIVQPPVHAISAWRVFRQLPDADEGRAFLAELLPRLAAWHAYLYRERADEHGLVEIWHPWESGMDNSPLWDEALARIEPAPGEVPPYERIDLDYADVTHRPTDREYDRYVYLVALMREAAYLPDRIRPRLPFAVQDVLFNALLVRADRDLAHIAREVGADPRPFEEWADWTATGIDARLWDEARGLYLDFDVRAGRAIDVRSGGGFAPLLAGVPDEVRARRLVETLDRFAVAHDGEGLLVPSLDLDDPRFEPARYWRGPVWPVVQWVVQAGLEEYGFRSRAARVRAGLTGLVDRSGFWEHYDPTSGRANGGEQFAWTAAIVLDVLQAGSGDRPAGEPTIPDGSGT